MFLTSNIVSGTECVFRTFRYEHIELQLCQNYSNYNETTTLLYKARAQQLNRFIADLIENGKLKNKTFTVEIYDPALTYNYINVSQSKSNYDIDFSGFLSFEEIAKIIFYFTQPNWKSFLYDPGKVKDKNQARQKFINIIDKYSLPDISSYISDSAVLWRLDNVSLKYSDDDIYYSINGQFLTYQPTSNLPVKIQDRFLFFQNDSIFVYDNGSTIQTFKTPEITRQDYTIERYNKWVNISLGSDEVLYSYSYEKNKFYDLTKRKNQK